MAGFGDMPSRGDTSSELDPEVHAAFVHAVDTIFPENTASRLARASGGVANRTAQKWISGAMTPPADVMAYVWKQHEIYLKSDFYEKLKQAYLANVGDLDDEVAMAMLARLYSDISGGYLIR